MTLSVVVEYYFYAIVSRYAGTILQTRRASLMPIRSALLGELTRLVTFNAVGTAIIIPCRPTVGDMIFRFCYVLCLSYTRVTVMRTFY